MSVRHETDDYAVFETLCESRRWAYGVRLDPAGFLELYVGVTQKELDDPVTFRRAFATGHENEAAAALLQRVRALSKRS